MPAAPVNPAKVAGRRTVRYESYAELLADAERLAGQPARTLGNWSFGQILMHLSYSVNGMLDGAAFAVPKPMQWLFKLLMFKRMTTRTLDPGFKLPAKAARMVPPDTTTVADGLAALRTAVARLEATDQRIPHPGFGRIANADWDAFQLRHCEMHMSFVVPAAAG